MSKNLIENFLSIYHPMEKAGSDIVKLKFSNKKFLKGIIWELVDKATCNVKEFFSDITVLPKNSASDTVQYIATLNTKKIKTPLTNYLKENRVFIKLIENISTKKQFMTELFVYRLTSILRHLRICPNNLEYIADILCGDKLYILTKPSIGIPGLGVTHFKKFMGEQLLSKRGPNFYVIGSLIFQTLYALRELNLAGVRHNDCHTMNVLIESDGTAKDYFYFVDQDTCVYIKTDHVAKIFDYDHATFTRSEDGDMMDHNFVNMICSATGECPVENLKFDPVIFLSTLYAEVTKNPLLVQLFKKLIPEPMLLDFTLTPLKPTWPNHPCKKDNPLDINEVCKNLVMTDDQVLPFEKMLLHLPGIEVMKVDFALKKYESLLLPNINSLYQKSVYVSQNYKGGIRELILYMKKFYDVMEI